MKRSLGPILIGVAVLAGPIPAHAVTQCSILDGPNCVPDICSVLNSQTCLPDQDFPLGGDLRLTISTQTAEAAPPRPDHDVNTLRDLFFTLRACWAPPPLADARKGMQMTVRVSFKRSGEMLSAPQTTYVLAEASQKIRDTYRSAIMQSLSGCTPLHFSRGLAGAIAGRPINIRYVDDRSSDDTPNSHN